MHAAVVVFGDISRTAAAEEAEAPCAVRCIQGGYITCDNYPGSWTGVLASARPRTARTVCSASRAAPRPTARQRRCRGWTESTAIPFHRFLVRGSNSVVYLLNNGFDNRCRGWTENIVSFQMFVVRESNSVVYLLNNGFDNLSK